MNIGQTAPAKTKLLIYSDQTLFAAGIEDMLRKQENLHIMGCESGLEQVLEAIGQYHPDVVLHTSWNEAGDFAPALMAILKQDASLKVVDINLQSNALNIYGKQLRVVREVDDLLEAIRGAVST